MENIKVDKAKLLQTLKKHRTNHKKIYEDAMIGFRKAVIREATKILKQAKSDGELILKIDLVRPISFEKEYDKVVGLLELCISDLVEIDEIDFEKYILDQWGWQSTFSSASSSYSSGASFSS